MSTEPHHALVLRRDYAALGDEAELRRRVERGQLTRVATGVYIPADAWSACTADQRYRLTVHAAALRYPDAVFSHRSAAALWRLPLVGAWPARAESIIARAGGGRSREGLVRYAVGAPAVVHRIEDVTVTGLARTVADCAAVSPLAMGVAFADRALQVVSRAELRSALVEGTHGRGWARARRVVEFADSRSESPGESLSRVSIAMAGFVPPLLQHDIADEDGFVGRVDFFWPQVSIVGEFDGHGKYLRQEWRDGRSAAQVAVAEKLREDRLRRHVSGLVRWGWEEARNPRRLQVILARAGVPRSRAGG